MYCSGKNRIAAVLEKRGIPVLDVDKLGHRAIETQKKAITGLFGDEILDSGGAINRKLLGEKVFGNPEKLAALEAIIHPAVNVLTDEWIKTQNGICVINAALLHRSSAFQVLNALIIVHAPFVTRFIRAVKRDKLPWFQLLKRLHSQKDFTSQYLSGKADIYRVENPGIFRQTITGRTKNRIDEILSFLGFCKV